MPPLLHTTLTAVIAQVLPSSALIGCAAQPHAGQVASHAVSAESNAVRWSWLKPTAIIEPQQSTWWKPNEQLMVVVHALGNVGNCWPAPQLPAIGGGHTPPMHVVPDEHLLPFAMQVTLAESQQPDEHAPPWQHAWPLPPHCTQVLSPQVRPDAEHVRPAQQT